MTDEKTLNKDAALDLRKELIPCLMYFSKTGVSNFEEEFQLPRKLGLIRNPVQEIDNVTICGLQERRNETVKVHRIKIIR